MGNNHTKMLKKFYELSNAGYFTILVFLIKLFGQKLKFALFITIDLLVVRIITFDFLDARPIFMVKNWSYKISFIIFERFLTNSNFVKK